MSNISISVQEWQRLSFAALQSVNATLSKESEALQTLASQYVEQQESQLDLINCLGLMYEANARGGKIVCCGIGKSFKLVTKTVATLKSLSINADQLHPSEALHGDLGLLRDNDCLIFFTASGNTPELIQLLPHIPQPIPIILLTCAKESKLSQHPRIKGLLLANLPEHLKETTIHGLPAPTVSTTLSLVLADAVVLALSEMIENDHMKRKKAFSMKHPGGSIGSDLSHLNDNYLRLETASSSSGQLKAPDSYTSLLSLGQLRDCFRTSSISSSPGASDTEDSYANTAVSVLSMKISTAPKNTYFTVSKDSFMKWSELDLLQNMALFDYIVYRAGNKVFAAECPSLRTHYKRTKAVGEEFSMDDFVSSFSPIQDPASR